MASESGAHTVSPPAKVLVTARDGSLFKPFINIDLKDTRAKLMSMGSPEFSLKTIRSLLW